MASLPVIIKGVGGPTLVESGSVNEDKYGLATAGARWWVLEESKIGLVGNLNSNHPTYASLTCERKQVSSHTAGYYIDAFYAGIIGGPPAPVYELDIGVSQRPLQSHPNAATFINTADGNSIFDGDGNFVKMSDTAPFGLAGMTHYEVPTLIGRETKIIRATGTGPAEMVLLTASLGKIDVPPAGIIGLVNTGTGNWLLLGASIEPRGSVFYIKREWKFSGPDQGFPIAVYL